jgi:threonine dehydratase
MPKIKKTRNIKEISNTIGIPLSYICLGDALGEKMLAKNDIEDAYERIRHEIVLSPCLYSTHLSDLTSARVFLKLENMQFTGSFKERGALNFLLAHQDKALKHVVAASAGNHAQAVACHAARLGVKATIFMPLNTPNNKIVQTERLQATVRLVGNNYDEAYSAAQVFAHDSQAKYIHGYDDPYVIAGQGTIGLEVVQQIGVPDIIIIPVGGGGMLAGMAHYFAHSSASKRPLLIGVEAQAYPSMAQALNADSEWLPTSEKTIADGIAVLTVGKLTHELCALYKPLMVSVSDEQIQNALMILLERQKIMSEGAGAAATAALLLAQNRELFLGKTVVVIVSGGNIDISLLSRLTGQALIGSSRMCRLSCVIKDLPGSLSKLLTKVTSASGNIIDIAHERSFAALKWNEVLVTLTVETKDSLHEKNLFSMLDSEGYDISIHKLEKNFGS